MVMEGAAKPLASSVICPAGGTSYSRFKQVCVFCGAYSGGRGIFEDAAVELGQELVRRKISLVYGGANVGLMGKVSRAVRDGGQHVTGIIPTALMEVAMGGREIVGEVVQVASMHERKAEMENRADAFIALPGGYGTLEELMEQITWSQLGIHDKPVGILNVDGYYDCLLAFLDKAVKEGFIEPSSRQIIVSSTSAVDLMNKLENYSIGTHVKVATKRSWEVHQRNMNSSCSNILISR